MNKKFLLYGHGGSYNHGAEAIIKSTVKLIKKSYHGSYIILSTHFKDQDIEFGIDVDEYCERDMDYVSLNKSSAKKGKYDKYIYKSVIDKIDKDTICLSVGGDNYCYDNWRKWKAIHDRAIEVGARSILWSCSIEPSMIDDEMLDVLKSHHLITARESITYDALKDRELDNVKLCSDVAFLLEPKKCYLPENFILGNTVGINISPLIVRREKIEGIVLKNIDKLIDSIISSTDMNIALIPHVLMPMDNDIEILEKIYNRCENKERICIVNKNISAAEYKYIISNCRLGLFARTHSSIAAYSTCVPTMVIGYSVKSKGIAKDLGLGDFVLPVEEFNDDYCMISMFNDLMENEQKIKQILTDKMPIYKERAKMTF